MLCSWSVMALGALRDLARFAGELLLDAIGGHPVEPFRVRLGFRRVALQLLFDPVRRLVQVDA